MSRVLLVASSLIIVSIIGYFLIIGSSILIPLVVAVFIWQLLNTFSRLIKQIPVMGSRLPDWLSMIIAMGIVVFSLIIFVNILTSNINGVIEASGRYQTNLMKIFDGIEQHYHIELLANLTHFMKALNLQPMLISLSGMFTSLASSTVLILLYIVFLFIEQHFLIQKIDAIFPAMEDRLLINNILTHIVHDIQSYMGLKSFLSIVTSIASWVIMKWVGLDFAEFWSLLIFFLNFIPNIGAIIAIIFPTILAAVQFPTWGPFFEILVGLGVVQFVVGNLIEPRFLSNSLNLSLLVILFALTLWGAIWGVLGMFLAIPITVMMMIVFAHFEQTRPIAILLSRDGDIFKTYELLSPAKTSEKNWLEF